MRIVIVNPVWDRAVATPAETLARFTTLTGWASAVRSNGAEAVTVCQRFPADAVIERDGVRYQFCLDRGRPVPGRSTRGTRHLHHAMLDAEPDVVHVNGVLFPEFIRGLRAALPARVALVVQDHGGFDPAAASALARVWIRRGLAAADTVLVSSPGQAGVIRRCGVAPPETLVTDVMESSTLLRPMPRSAARAAMKMTGMPALLWVGRLNANKDPLTVLRGATTWFRTWPTATLTMVFQSGDLDRSVRELVAATPELARRVTLVGAVPHDRLAEYYSAADLFVLGSHHEGSGYAVIEALACGAAPVVTDIAPFRALTNHGSVGALWEAGNASAFADALTRAMTRSLARQRMDARELFERAFSWPVIGRRAVGIYREVMASRDRSRATARTHTPP